MKREERNTLNMLRKNVTTATICVDVPERFTKEGRQAIHEMLTVEKHFRAVRINWISGTNDYGIHYVPSNVADYIANSERMRQESMDVDDVAAGLARSDYSWTGYLNPAVKNDDDPDPENTPDPVNVPKTEKKKTLAARRADPLYNSSLILHGNGKLLDYIDDDGHAFRYAQYNQRALVDCPFKSAGCTAVCYATKGNHVFPDVIASRIRSHENSKRPDFAESIIYTIEVEKDSKRYKDATMIIRIHESGDFYSIRYLRDWIKVWNHFSSNDGVLFVFYTKSFKFFNMLDDAEKDIIRRAQKAGYLAISASMDDTTTAAQKIEYLAMISNYPLTNTYYCTENVDTVAHDTVCDCKDCARCGTCNKATGKKTVVKIHSASNDDMKVYRENIA